MDGPRHSFQGDATLVPDLMRERNGPLPPRGSTERSEAYHRSDDGGDGDGSDGDGSSEDLTCCCHRALVKT